MSLLHIRGGEKEPQVNKNNTFIVFTLFLG